MGFEELLSGSITELGVGASAIFAIVYLVKIFTANSRDLMKSEREERIRNQDAFVNFVNSNNHKMTEHVQASTSALLETRKAIESHTDIVKELTKAIINKK